MIKFILAVLLLVAVLGQPFRAAGAPPAGPAPLNGQWKGPLKLLGGEITLYITIVPLSNGTYYAALDAPQQRISRMPVEVELKGDDLTLRIEQAGSRFVGKVLNDGASLSGTWTQPGLTAPLVLLRAAASKQAANRLRAAPPYRESDVAFLNPATRQHLSGRPTRSCRGTVTCEVSAYHCALAVGSVGSREPSSRLLGRQYPPRYGASSSNTLTREKEPRRAPCL